MKKLFKIFSVISVFALGILVGAVLINASSILIAEEQFYYSNRQNKVEYSVNKNGQTYGSTMGCSRIEDFPDLIGATDKNGQEGYVYFEDLYGDLPTSPEEAVIYMEEMENANKRGINKKIIPLYDSDGKTVIGEYEIAYDAGMFSTLSEYNSSNKSIWD